MRYRRAKIPGGSFFFTVVTERRRALLTAPDAVDVLRTAFRVVRERRPFRVEAAVILPDHLHCIWTLPPGDTDFATRRRLVKTWVTRHLDPAHRPLPNRVRAAKQEQALWQRRYWEHALRDESDFVRHVEYLHWNPVKHGLASSALDGPFSSSRRYVGAGLYPEEWGTGLLDFEGIGHE